MINGRNSPSGASARGFWWRSGDDGRPREPRRARRLPRVDEELEVRITGTATTGHFSGAVKLAGQSATTFSTIGCDTLWYGVTSTNTATVVPSNYGDCLRA